MVLQRMVTLCQVEQQSEAWTKWRMPIPCNCVCTMKMTQSSDSGGGGGKSLILDLHIVTVGGQVTNSEVGVKYSQ